MKIRKLLRNKQAIGIVTDLGIVISLLVGIAIGVLVFYELNESMVNGMPDVMSATLDTSANGKAARAAWNTTNTTASTSWTLLPILAIVIIAGIVLFVVTRFGSGQVPY